MKSLFSNETNQTGEENFSIAEKDNHSDNQQIAKDCSQQFSTEILEANQINSYLNPNLLYSFTPTHILRKNSESEFLNSKNFESPNISLIPAGLNILSPNPVENLTVLQNPVAPEEFPKPGRRNKNKQPLSHYTIREILKRMPSSFKRADLVKKLAHDFVFEISFVDRELRRCGFNIKDYLNKNELSDNILDMRLLDLKKKTFGNEQTLSLPSCPKKSFRQYTLQQIFDHVEISGSISASIKELGIDNFHRELKSCNLTVEDLQNHLSGTNKLSVRLDVTLDNLSTKRKSLKRYTLQEILNLVKHADSVEEFVKNTNRDLQSVGKVFTQCNITYCELKDYLKIINNLESNLLETQLQHLKEKKEKPLINVNLLLIEAQNSHSCLGKKENLIQIPKEDITKKSFKNEADISSPPIPIDLGIENFALSSLNKYDSSLILQMTGLENTNLNNSQLQNHLSFQNYTLNSGISSSQTNQLVPSPRLTKINMKQEFELSFDSDSEFEFFEVEIKIPAYYPCSKSESCPIIEEGTYPEILLRKFTPNIQDNMSAVMNLDELTFIRLLKHFKNKRHFMTYFHFPQNEFFERFSNYKLLANQSLYINKIEIYAKKLSKIISNHFNEPRKRTSDILFINQFKSLLENEFPKKSSAAKCFFNLDPKAFLDFISLFSNQADIIKKLGFNKAFHSEKNKLDPDIKYKSDSLKKLNNSFWCEIADELSENIPSYFETMNEIEIIEKINQLTELMKIRDKVRCLLKIEDSSFKKVVKLFLNQKDFCQGFSLDSSDLSKLKKGNQTKLIILNSKDNYRESHGVFLSENNKLIINKYSSITTSERLGLNPKKHLSKKNKNKGKFIFKQMSKKLKVQNNNLSTDVV